ncbi:MarR family winged helix-turn-helix transcriptional regulator [Desulfofundulus sp.]|uniref:MarR family winged helix-turn-helix transcriptional regulator n=1 Tax=Desulfofundulus sp. TaxID=2282750 RepID=UPI003C74DAAD
MELNAGGFGPSRYICFKLNKVMRKIQRYYENSLSPYNITPVQFYVLSALWVSDGIRFKDLARVLNMDGSTLTGILDRMERLDLVERRDDPEDRRSLLIFLKEKARLYQKELVELAENLDREIKEQFPPGEFAIFERVLDKLMED